MGYQRRIRFPGPRSGLPRVEFGGSWEVRLRRRERRMQQPPEPATPPAEGQADQPPDGEGR